MKRGDNDEKSEKREYREIRKIGKIENARNARKASIKRKASNSRKVRVQENCLHTDFYAFYKYFMFYFAAETTYSDMRIKTYDFTCKYLLSNLL